MDQIVMMERKRGRFVSLAAVAAVISLGIGGVFAGSPASAQEGEGANQSNELPPGEWVKRCSDRENGRFCEISFGRFLDIGDRRVWIARAGLFETGEQRDLFIFTPLGSALRRGVLYRVDTNEPKAAEYSVCLQIQGCQAITSADQATIDALKAGNELLIQFTVANRPPLITKVTLAGFTAAYDGEPAAIIHEEPPAGGGGEGGTAGGGGETGGGDAGDTSSGKGDAPAP